MSQTNESAATEETAENAPRRRLFPVEAATTAPEEDTFSTLSPVTDEMDAAVASATFAPRRKRFLAESATVFRSMI